MSQFILFIDGVGAEFCKARVTRKDVAAFYDWKPIRFTPTAVRPIEVVDEGGAPKRAAGGFLLLGPLGAAAGVLLGKGPKVVFDFDLPDGTTRRGVVHQRDYPALRRRVEAIQTHKPGHIGKIVAAVIALIVFGPALLFILGPIGIVTLVFLGLGIAWRSRSLRRRRDRAAA